MTLPTSILSRIKFTGLNIPVGFKSDIIKLFEQIYDTPTGKNYLLMV